jgi:hypothetical protein
MLFERTDISWWATRLIMTAILIRVDARGRRGFAAGNQSLKFKVDENLLTEYASILRGAGFEAVSRRHSETRDLNTDKADSRLSRFDESPLGTVLERDEIPKNYQRTLRPLYRLNF